MRHNKPYQSTGRVQSVGFSPSQGRTPTWKNGSSSTTPVSPSPRHLRKWGGRWIRRHSLGYPGADAQGYGSRQAVLS